MKRKKIELASTALLLPLDLIAVVWSIGIANAFRSNLDILPIAEGRVSETGYAFLLWYFPLLVFLIANQGMYLLKESRTALMPLRIFIATASAGMLQFLVVLAGRTPFIANHYPQWYEWASIVSLLTIFYLWITAAVLIVGIRTLYNGILTVLFWLGIGRRCVLVIGNGQGATILSKRLGKTVSIELRRTDGPNKENDYSLENLINSVRKYSPDEIILAQQDLPNEYVLQIIDLAYEAGADFSFVPNLFEATTSNVKVTSVAHMPLLELRRTPLDGWGRILKRFVDLFLSALLLLVLSPVFLIAMLAIKIQDGGAIFFGQSRVSSDGTFKMYKFRSMVPNAEAMEEDLRKNANERGDGPLFKMKEDPRVTRLGKFLRKSRIDELPQLYNVLRGDMSLVGPRPHLAREVQQYKKHHKKVLAIKPGMTGLAQVAGNSDLSFEEEVRLDTYYIENWSIWKDLEILCKTPYMILIKDRAGF